MQRAYYQETFDNFINENSSTILGELTQNHNFALDDLQKNSWIEQINQLKTLLPELPEGYVFLEFAIPRMGKRVDTILVIDGTIFVLEYKVGTSTYDKHSIEQTIDYALDLKNFHEGSHNKVIIPILVATGAENRIAELTFDRDMVASITLANQSTLGSIIKSFLSKQNEIYFNAIEWAISRYKPTPTIIEAAQALYKNHSVEEISRSDSGAINLSHTNASISQVIENSKLSGKKSICFITGVPGAGKTLAGLNIATTRMNIAEDEHAVFLSGNGPLVDVLREALAIDEVKQSKLDPSIPNLTKKAAYQNASTFIQNIHHFRDDNLTNPGAPIEKVVVFDEAQRAWSKEQTSRFMREKRGIVDFDMSEPEFLLSVMDRHESWCTVVCLIGGGQEINRGEAGLTEWLAALKDAFPNWDVHCSSEILGKEYSWGKNINDQLTELAATKNKDMHLAVSIRSFRAEHLSNFINSILHLDMKSARNELALLDGYPLFITRDLDKARNWLRDHARGSERTGLVASSNANRLKPLGVNVRDKPDPKSWFLKENDDIRSSSFLENVATEFDIQGLELDWVGMCWGADLRYTGSGWSMHNFKGSKWTNVHKDFSKQYLINAYRVLLTRARQGLIIFVPEGSDIDHTRPAEFYDASYEYLKSIGIPEL